MIERNLVEFSNLSRTDAHVLSETEHAAENQPCVPAKMSGNYPYSRHPCTFQDATRRGKSPITVILYRDCTEPTSHRGGSPPASLSQKA